MSATDTIAEINSYIESQLMNFKLIDLQVKSFDFQNGFVSGYKIFSEDPLPRKIQKFFLIKYRFLESYVYTNILFPNAFKVGRGLDTLPLFTDFEPLDDGFDEHIKEIEQNLESFNLYNYSYYAKKHLKYIKETLNGSTNNF